MALLLLYHTPCTATHPSKSRRRTERKIIVANICCWRKEGNSGSPWPQFGADVWMSNRIDGEIGNDPDLAAIGSNIKQEKSAVTGNIVNVYGTEAPTGIKSQRSLSLEIEQEFRARFDKISEKLEANTVAVTRLEGTLDKSNILHQAQIDTLKQNQRSLEELAKDTDAKIVRTLAGLHIVAAPPAPPAPVTSERDWMVSARLVFQALTALSALGLLAYFVMGGGG